MKHKGGRLQHPMREAFRVLLAHDASSPTCDALIDVLRGLYDADVGDGSVDDGCGGGARLDLVEAVSVQDACAAVGADLAAGTRDSIIPVSTRDGQLTRFDLCLVCLDLPPVPQGGVRIAREFVRQGLPIVLVTRSLRWLPTSADDLRAHAWVSPEAQEDELRVAVASAIANAHLAAQLASQSMRSIRNVGRVPAADAPTVRAVMAAVTQDRMEEIDPDGLDPDDPASGARPSLVSVEPEESDEQRRMRDTGSW